MKQTLKNICKQIGDSLLGNADAADAAAAGGASSGPSSDAGAVDPADAADPAASDAEAQHAAEETARDLERLRGILQTTWGYPDFRGIQQDIILSIFGGHDTLGLMPTGGGKSITFQVPALAMEGMCVVVTPLIALMKDQVDNLRRRGIRAAAVYSGMSRDEVMQKLDNAVLGGYKFLYVSPERLATSIFREKMRRMHICFLTVDEAHCISQWGYDFRPEYMRIAEVRDLLRREGETDNPFPILALTATATPDVCDDIERQLGFVDGRRYRMSFERANLHYIVRETDNKYGELLHILSMVEGSAIVYTRSRRKTREIADALKEEGITAYYYHAGLTSLDKDIRQREWQNDNVRVMVATNAFGMGIDKPDVRLVIHMDVPDSVEAYFQEAGRGGRDGQTAYAVLLHSKNDIRILRQRIPQQFPDREYIRKVYEDLAFFYSIAEGDAEGRTFEFDITRFCRIFHHSPFTLMGALGLLTRAGYITYHDEDPNSSRVIFLVRRDDLYHIDYLEPVEERVLNALMRQTCGLFADYMPIEEARLAKTCSLSGDDLYKVLISLNRKRVLHYVPHKNMPMITYVMRRIDKQYVEIGRDIYDVMRDRYVKRVEAMIDYMTRDDMCRSRFLLHYFDDDAPDCGYCDVCIAHERLFLSLPRKEQLKEVRARILAELEERGVCEQRFLWRMGYAWEYVHEVLDELISEEKIRCDGVHILSALPPKKKEG